MGLGIALYDALSRMGAYGGAMPRPKQLSKAAVATIAPGLRGDVLTGAVRFHDAQIDDARHTVAVARTAVGLGTRILTRTRVTDLLREGGRVVGARVQHGDDEFEIHAKVVIAAAGVWTDEVRSLLNGKPAGEVRQSRGIHLVVPRSAFDSSSAVIARTPHSVLFMLPWGQHWLVGTTDTDADGDLAEPEVTAEDVEYLLGQANRWLTRPLVLGDVEGVYAGLRPLLAADENEPTTSLSREHAVLNPAPGLFMVAGGKYTTYRVMAKDVVDKAAKDLQAGDPTLEIPESFTHDLPLVGAVGYRTAWASRGRTAREAGLSVEAVEGLLRRHGDRIGDVLDLLSDPDLAKPLHPDSDVLRAEAVVAATYQGATSVADVLIRRTRIATECRDRGMGSARDVAMLIAPVLGWDQARIDAEATTDIPQPYVPIRASEGMRNGVEPVAVMGEPDGTAERAGGPESWALANEGAPRN